MRHVETRTGARMPVLGLGTWKMGERRDRRDREVAALRLGLDLGMTLVDTAEMYGSGGAEQVVGEAIRGRRDEVFLVSKVLPENATEEGTIRAAEASLRRLGCEHLDLYLLHWAGPHPMEATRRGFERLRQAGKIRHWGVSNFDTAEMQAAEALPYGDGCAANQVLYNLTRRGIEPGLLPWCRERRIAVMAYSPLEQGRLRQRQALVEVAERHGCTPSQVALAWTIRGPGVVVIPKASDPNHVRENAAALDLTLDAEDLRRLDVAYPPPRRDGPLEVL